MTWNTRSLTVENQPTSCWKPTEAKRPLTVAYFTQKHEVSHACIDCAPDCQGMQPPKGHEGQRCRLFCSGLSLELLAVSGNHVTCGYTAYCIWVPQTTP